MKILAFDVGTKRIGVAVSDSSGTIAAGVGYLDNDGKLEEKLIQTIAENPPEMFVVGNPINMNGSENVKSTFVADFVKLLEKNGQGKDIKMWDERLTTVMAERTLIKANVKRKKRKQVIDQLAAVLILQNYLDYLKNAKDREQK